MIENKNRKMKFRAHETFFIRKGWLSKGMKYVQQTNGEVFISKTENPVDVLGLGTNMVKALRYWLQVVELTEENPKTRKQNLSELGTIIFEKDRYLEEIGTLLLLQYKLATNSEKATSWWYFFNYFNQTEFNVNDFLLEISKWIKNENDDEEDVSKKIRSLTDDFNCIINTYFSKTNIADKSPENNIDCPFVELGLIGTGSKTKTFRKKTPLIDNFNPYITLALILDFSKNELSGKSEIQLNSLLQNKNSIGKVFNLDSISLIEILRKVEKIGELKIIRTAGLDVIQITNPEKTFLDCIKQYYEELSDNLGEAK